MKPQAKIREAWYAYRSVHVPADDERNIASVLIWIEHQAKEGGTWLVGRASDLEQRDNVEPRAQDYLFTGFEIDDALQVANDALEDELVASDLDGIHEDVRAFTHRELQEPLEQWFWGRRPS